MSPLLLETLNLYTGLDLSEPEAVRFIAAAFAVPVPERLSMDDWQAHVPMHLLEGWRRLSDDERVVIYVMAQCATHPYECTVGPEYPGMN
jgi:hypothetical protein